VGYSSKLWNFPHPFEEMIMERWGIGRWGVEEFRNWELRNSEG